MTKGQIVEIGRKGTADERIHQIVGEARSIMG